MSEERRARLLETLGQPREETKTKIRAVAVPKKRFWQSDLFRAAAAACLVVGAVWVMFGSVVFFRSPIAAYEFQAQSSDGMVASTETHDRESSGEPAEFAESAATPPSVTPGLPEATGANLSSAASASAISSLAANSDSPAVPKAQVMASLLATDKSDSAAEIADLKSKLAESGQKSEQMAEQIEEITSKFSAMAAAPASAAPDLAEKVTELKQEMAAATFDPSELEQLKSTLSASEAAKVPQVGDLPIMGRMYQGPAQSAKPAEALPQKQTDSLAKEIDGDRFANQEEVDANERAKNAKGKAKSVPAPRRKATAEQTPQFWTDDATAKVNLNTEPAKKLDELQFNEQTATSVFGDKPTVYQDLDARIDATDANPADLPAQTYTETDAYISSDQDFKSKRKLELREPDSLTNSPNIDINMDYGATRQTIKAKPKLGLAEGNSYNGGTLAAGETITNGLGDDKNITSAGAGPVTITSELPNAEMGEQPKSEPSDTRAEDVVVWKKETVLGPQSFEFGGARVTSGIIDTQTITRPAEGKKDAGLAQGDATKSDASRVGVHATNSETFHDGNGQKKDFEGFINYGSPIPADSLGENMEGEPIFSTKAKEIAGKDNSNKASGDDRLSELAMQQNAIDASLPQSSTVSESKELEDKIVGGNEVSAGNRRGYINVTQGTIDALLANTPTNAPAVPEVPQADDLEDQAFEFGGARVQSPIIDTRSFTDEQREAWNSRHSGTAKKLRRIAIPEVKFENLPIKDALMQLEAESRLQGQPIKIDLNNLPDGADEPKITLNLKNVPLGVVLKSVTDLSGLKYRISEDGVAVGPLSANLDTFVTKEYELSKGLGNVAPTTFLAARGMSFPFGSSAEVVNGRLVVKNTPANLAILDATSEASEKNPLQVREFPLTPSIAKNTSALQALKAMGVDFPPKSSAVSSNNKLIVRNTAANLDLIAHLIEAEQTRIRQQQTEGEISASTEPFSTFSLHVADVSFELAKQALAKNEVPDPTKIRPEEFYNAFDYGDPAPGSGEEVACKIEQSAHPFLQQRNLVRIAVKVGSTGRAGAQPLKLTILLDTSGSMEREDRAASVRKALESLATLLGPNDSVTLIGFARKPRLIVQNLPGDQAAKLIKLAEETPSEGGTNLEQALKLAGELALKQLAPNAQNRIVLLTDGAANLGNADPEVLGKQVELLRQKKIAFDACGVGAQGYNDDILEALTRKGDGRYYFLNRPEDAGPGFAAKLAGAFRPAAENVKLQVHFNPQRVGKYKLVGFEKHLLKKEDFRNDKVDAAELAAEEAAVALYQVEILPEGEGELGEVFVRFRVPANADMVERSWTMPYDANAPGFDQASPTMQLAGIAMIAAEKLRHLPGIDSADWDQLTRIAEGLRGSFPGNQRVVDLVEMLRKIAK